MLNNTSKLTEQVTSKLVRGYDSLVYLSSARPSTEQTVIRNTLKEADEPALHMSLTPQVTAQASMSSFCLELPHSCCIFLHDMSEVQEFTTIVLPSYFILRHDLIQTPSQSTWYLQGVLLATGISVVPSPSPPSICKQTSCEPVQE